MNGASEFWVRLPAFAHQLETIPIEFIDNWHYTDILSEGYSSYRDIGTTEIHSGVYLYEGVHGNLTVDGDDTAGIFDLRGDSGATSIANGIISKERNNYNNSLYHKFNVVVNSDVTYTIAFLMISREKPYLMLDEVESNYSRVIYKTIDVTGCYADTKSWGYPPAHSKVMMGLKTNVSEGHSETVDLLLEPHFSFIFTRGIGDNNMFGYTTNNNDTVKINIHYPDFDFDGVVDKYPSFYVPFIMDGDYDEGISPAVNVKLGTKDGSLLVVDELEDGIADFAYDDHHYNWLIEDYEYKFNNYFLFSSPHITSPSFPVHPDELYTELTFNDIPYPLTFLCKKNDGQLYNKNPNSLNYSSSSFWLGENFVTGHDNSFSEVKEVVDNVSYTYWDVDYTEYGERYFYEIFTSFQFTEGRWNTIKLPPQTVILSWSEMEERGIENNTVIKGRHNDYTIIGQNGTEQHLNTHDRSNSERAGTGGIFSYIGKDWWKPQNLPSTLIGVGRWLLDSVIAGMRTMIDSLWTGLQTIWAFIRTIPNRIWEGLQALGTWISRTVMEFIAPILEVLGDLWAMGGMFIEVLSYVFAFLLFFLVMYIVVKVISKTEGVFNETV